VDVLVQEDVGTLMAGGGMRIVTIEVTVRAGGDDEGETWSDTATSVSIEVEPGWPEHIALAAAQGGMKSALKAIEERYAASVERAVRDEEDDDER
jgi:hypothetical protein